MKLQSDQIFVILHYRITLFRPTIVILNLFALKQRGGGGGGRGGNFNPRGIKNHRVIGLR